MMQKIEAADEPRKKLMAYNIRRILDDLDVKQKELAKWWGCDPSYINQVVQARRALGDDGARKFLKFCADRGLRISQADLLLPIGTTVPKKEGRIVSVRRDLSNLQNVENSEVVAMELAHTQDPHAFYLVADRAELCGGPIQEGDLLLVEPEAKINIGAVVLAQIQGIISVRRYHRQGSITMLQSLSNLPPFILGDDADDGGQVVLRRVTKITRNI